MHFKWHVNEWTSTPTKESVILHCLPAPVQLQYCVCLRSWPSEEQITWRVIFSNQSPQSSLLKRALTLHSETIHASQDSQNAWNWAIVWKAQSVHPEEYFQVQARQQVRGQKDSDQYIGTRWAAAEALWPVFLASIVHSVLCNSYCGPLLVMSSAQQSFLHSAPSGMYVDLNRRTERRAVTKKLPWLHQEGSLTVFLNLQSRSHDTHPAFEKAMQSPQGILVSSHTINPQVQKGLHQAWSLPNQGLDSKTLQWARHVPSACCVQRQRWKCNCSLINTLNKYCREHINKWFHFRLWHSLIKKTKQGEGIESDAKRDDVLLFLLKYSWVC